MLCLNVNRYEKTDYFQKNKNKTKKKTNNNNKKPTTSYHYQCVEQP